MSATVVGVAVRDEHRGERMAEIGAAAVRGAQTRHGPGRHCSSYRSRTGNGLKAVVT